MALYIQSNQDLAQHRKIRRLTRTLKISLPDAIGRLHLLWWWALTYAQDGNMGACDAEDIADVMMWEDDPETLLDALINCGGKDSHGFIDRDEEGGLSLHDWADHCKIFEERAKDAERKRLDRAAKKRDVPSASTGQEQDEHGSSESVQRTSDGHPQDIHGNPSLDRDKDKDKDKRLKTPLTGAADAASPAGTDGELPTPETYLPISEAPHAFRQTAEYLCLKTGRKGLTEGDVAALRTLNAAHTPARVMKEIDAAVERFRRKQRPLVSLDFGYIAGALAHQSSLPQKGGGGLRRTTGHKREPAPEFSPAEARTFTPEEEAALEALCCGRGDQKCA